MYVSTSILYILFLCYLPTFPLLAFSHSLITLSLLQYLIPISERTFGIARAPARLCLLYWVVLVNTVLLAPGLVTTLEPCHQPLLYHPCSS